jgi:hypothetical protein
MDHSFFIYKELIPKFPTLIQFVLLRPVLKGNNKALSENGEDGIAMLILYAN